MNRLKNWNELLFSDGLRGRGSRGIKEARGGIGGSKDVSADVSMLTVFIGVNHPEIPARPLVE